MREKEHISKQKTEGLTLADLMGRAGTRGVLFELHCPVSMPSNESMAKPSRKFYPSLDGNYQICKEITHFASGPANAGLLRVNAFSACQHLEEKLVGIRIALAERKTSSHCW